MNSQFNEHLNAHMEGVLAKFRASTSITHNGEKGRAREALVSTAIEPWFGPEIQIGSGFVIDSFGNSSKQTDNVIYWPSVLPKMMLGGHAGGPGLFPVEGVAAAIEVKSTLTTGELSSAIKNLASIRTLQERSSAPMDSEGNRPAHFSIKPLSSIVAFGSDVAPKTLRQALIESIAWDCICILGKNGGVFTQNNLSPKVARRQLLPGSATDTQKLAVYSIITRDNIQNSRLYRMAAGLECYIDFDNNNFEDF